MILLLAFMLGFLFAYVSTWLLWLFMRRYNSGNEGQEDVEGQTTLLRSGERAVHKKSWEDKQIHARQKLQVRKKQEGRQEKGAFGGDKASQEAVGSEGGQEKGGEDGAHLSEKLTLEQLRLAQQLENMLNYKGTERGQKEING
ncbi:MAG: hypothetical protein RR315_07065 [Oscillospiraceae bacterium]